MIEYGILKIIWWLFLGVILIGFAVMDGFDLGIGMLMHKVAHNNDEKRVLLNTIGPVWEGNQIWLVLAGGAIFAAWPMIYAVSFSGFYFAMLIILWSLILRPVGFKYRNKINHESWRKLWDIGLFLGGFIPALFFGIAVGNVLQGVPFHFDLMLRSYYTGTLLGLLNPFALLCGFISVTMMLMHGGIFLAIKTTSHLQRRAAKYAQFNALILSALFAVAGVWAIYQLNGYLITSEININEPANPLYKQVVVETGAWFLNYEKYPLFFIAPLTGLVCALLTFILINFAHYRTAWISSACAIAGVVTTAEVSIFPFLLPSSTNPNMSLTIWDASSSQETLFIMLIATLIFLPLIIMYTSWVYYVLRGKVTDEYIKQNTKQVY